MPTSISIEKYASSGIVASVETGYKLKVAENAEENTAIFIRLKGSITGMNIKAKNHVEVNGTLVSGVGSGHVQTHFGIVVSRVKQTISNDGQARSFEPFIETSWIHNSNNFWRNNKWRDAETSRCK